MPCIDCKTECKTFKRCYPCNMKFKNEPQILIHLNGIENCPNFKSCNNQLKGTFKHCYDCTMKIKKERMDRHIHSREDDILILIYI